MRLDRLITFYEPVLTKSASGMETKTYRQLTALPQAWSQVTWLNTKGRERDEGKQRVASTTVEFGIRYRTDLTKTMVIEFDGKYFDILKINDLQRRQWLILEAEEKDNDWQLPL